MKEKGRGWQRKEIAKKDEKGRNKDANNNKEERGVSEEEKKLNLNNLVKKREYSEDIYLSYSK